MIAHAITQLIVGVMIAHAIAPVLDRTIAHSITQAVSGMLVAHAMTQVIVHMHQVNFQPQLRTYF